MIESIKKSVRIVFSYRRYKIIFLITALLMAFLYINAGQIITFFPDGVYFEFSPIRIFTIIAVSILFGLVLPMQLYSLKMASVRIKEGGITTSGVLTGMLGMSCCAPVLPSLLVLAGFSGTFLLSLNTLLQQYLLPLSLLSILLLLISVHLLSKNIAGVCKISRG